MKTVNTYKSVVNSHNNAIFRRRTSQALSSLSSTSEVLSLFESSKHHVDPLLLPAFLTHPSVKDPSPSADLLPLAAFSLNQLRRRSFSPVAYAATYAALADVLGNVPPSSRPEMKLPLPAGFLARADAASRVRLCGALKVKGKVERVLDAPGIVEELVDMR